MRVYAVKPWRVGDGLLVHLAQDQDEAPPWASGACFGAEIDLQCRLGRDSNCRVLAVRGRGPSGKPWGADGPDVSGSVDPTGSTVAVCAEGGLRRAAGSLTSTKAGSSGYCLDG